MAAARWVSTVLKEILKLRAISLFVRPSAISLTMPACRSFFPHRPTRSTLERQFKQLPPVFVGDDNHSTARPSVPSIIRQTLLRAEYCFFLSLSRVCEFDAFLVQYGHLTTFNVEEVSRHLEALPRARELCAGNPMGRYSIHLSQNFDVPSDCCGAMHRGCNSS